MVKPHSRVVLLTGASAGIGLAIARRLMNREDLMLVLTARPSSLARFDDAGIVESDRLWLRPLEITSGEDRERLVEEIDRELGGVDVLINNAGITYRSVVEHVTEKERIHQMGVNFRGPMELSRLCLPRMREKRAGKILNISSVGGMMAMPTMGVYSASKFALEGASEALFYEVKPWNIQVSLLQLGFIRSDAFMKVPYTEHSRCASENREDSYYKHYECMTNFIGTWMRRSRTSPEQVAKKVERMINRRRLPLRVKGTPDAVLFSIMLRTLPAPFYHWILYQNLPCVKKWGHPKKY